MHPDDTNVLASLQEMLNHDSMKTTLHYSGQTKDTLKTLYNDIGKIFTGEAINQVETKDAALNSKLDSIISMLCPETT